MLFIYCNDNNIFGGELGILGREELLLLNDPSRNPELGRSKEKDPRNGLW